MKFDESSLYRIESNIAGERFSLFDLAQWKNGLAFRKIDFSEVGIPVIKIAELNNGIGSTTAYTQREYDKSVFIQKGDLLFPGLEILKHLLIFIDLIYLLDG